MNGILTLIIALLMNVGALGPIERHVKWGYVAKRTSPTEATIIIRAKIDEGWHIYSQHIEEGGPTKTQFVFSPSNQYKLIGKTIEPNVPAKFDKFFKMNVATFEKEAVFQQKIRIKTADKPITVNVKLAFGVCNAKSCLPPDEANFSLAVPLK